MKNLSNDKKVETVYSSHTQWRDGHLSSMLSIGFEGKIECCLPIAVFIALVCEILDEKFGLVLPTRCQPDKIDPRQVGQVVRRQIFVLIDFWAYN